MDEIVTVNLRCFFLLPLLSPARTIPSPALIIPSPLVLLTTLPFPLNKLPNKLAPNVPSNILKNPLYSF